jgi:hypothetical protein
MNDIKEIDDEIIELKKIIDTMVQYYKKYSPFESFYIGNLKQDITINLLNDIVNISSIIDNLILVNSQSIPVPKKPLNAENFLGMLAGKIDENIINKFNKKTNEEIKDEIYNMIMKIDRVSYGNYADIDNTELIIIIILSEALLAKRKYEDIVKNKGTKEQIETMLKELYIKKINLLV